MSSVKNCKTQTEKIHFRFILDESQRVLQFAILCNVQTVKHHNGDGVLNIWYDEQSTLQGRRLKSFSPMNNIRTNQGCFGPKN